MASTAARTTRSLTVQVAEMQARLRRDGIAVADMRSAQALEFFYAGVPDLRMPSADGRGDEIERLEGEPVTAWSVPEARGPSRLRFFLDGSQRTLQVLRLGLVPVATTIAVAAVLRRNAAGGVEIAPGTLRFRHAWLIPTRASEPGLPSLLEMIAESGGLVIDPLGDVPDGEYQAIAGDYGKLVQAAYVAARHVREELELALLDDWGLGLPERDADDWLVVDGRLRLVVPNAIGVVKALTQQHLTGPEAVTVFNLAPGQRTTSFRVLRDYHRDPGARYLPTAPAASGEGGAPALWYLRLRDSAGQDARHALVRVEAGPRVRGTAEIDEIAAWLLAERAPRATGDARWATLLYPIHLLEEILKRRVDAHTRGWPTTKS